MKNKTAWIVVGIVLAFALLVGGLFVSSNNKAIFLEEQINAAQADINVAEKRRFDLVYNLVDAVQSYQDYEGGNAGEHRFCKKQHGVWRCGWCSDGNQCSC